MGIDFGLKTFLTLSDNTKIDSPKYYLNALNNLKQKQRKLSRKKNGSNNRVKVKKALARAYITMTNKRKDYFFKLANSLSKKYDYIFIEDLDIKAMSKIWGKKIHDLAFSEFISILSTKTNVVKIDKFYPSSKTCSVCGYINTNLKLKDRIFECPNCKIKIDRDYNASININRVGASTFGVELVRPV